MNMDASSTPRLRYVLLTFNPHSGNPQDLSDFLTIFLPKVHDKCTSYAYCREKVGTPSEHFHCLFSGKFKDNNAANTFVMTVKMKKFKDSLKTSNTQWDIAYDLQFLPDTIEDKLTILGYIQKSEDKQDMKTQTIKGFTKEQCLQAVEIYYTTERHKKKQASQKSDWIILTKKNAHSIITNFCKTHNKSVRDDDLTYVMKSTGHSFVDLTAKAQKEIYDEILIKDENPTEIEEEILKDEITNKLRDGKYGQTDVFESPAITDYALQLHSAQTEIQRLKDLVEKLDKTREYPWIYQNDQHKGGPL